MLTWFRKILHLVPDWLTGSATVAPRKIADFALCSRNDVLAFFKFFFYLCFVSIRLPSGRQAPRRPWQSLQLLLPGRRVERRVQPLRAATDRYHAIDNLCGAMMVQTCPSQRVNVFLWSRLQISWTWRRESPSTLAEPQSRTSCPSLRPCWPANTGREYRHKHKPDRLAHWMCVSSLMFSNVSRRDEDSYQKFIPFIGVRFYFFTTPPKKILLDRLVLIMRISCWHHLPFSRWWRLV